MVATFALGVFGSIIGSFLNVVIYRVPAGRSLMRPASACGSCGHEIRWYDNVPVISWVLLRGRCRDCSAPISVRYPLVELGSAVFFALVAWHFLPAVLTAPDAASAVGAGIQLAVYLYLAAISIALALIDIDVKRLPNSIVLPAYVVALVALTASAAATGDWVALGRAAIGMGALGLFYFLLALVPGAMGMGDVKLAGVLGAFLAWLGWGEFLVGVIAGFLAGGIAGVVSLLRGRRKVQIPYGPFLLGGAWCGILVGAPLLAAYLGLFGLTT